MLKPSFDSNRRFWIEVSNGKWTWGDMANGQSGEDKRSLKAPALPKYIQMLKPLRPGDIVLTYFSSKIAESRELAGSIGGISQVDSTYRQEGNVLIIDTVENTRLSIPIRFSELRAVEESSGHLKFAIRANFQRYVFEILQSDVITLFEIHPENKPIWEKFQDFPDLLTE